MLLSGGVGLTPMMSMLETHRAAGAGRPAWYVHGARERPRPRHGRACAGAGGRKAGNVTVRTFYKAPEAGDVAGRDYDERGPDHASTGWRATRRSQEADLLPVRPAAVPARLRRRAGPDGRSAGPDPLRVLRTGRRNSWPLDTSNPGSVKISGIRGVAGRSRNATSAVCYSHLLLARGRMIAEALQPDLSDEGRSQFQCAFGMEFSSKGLGLALGHEVRGHGRAPKRTRERNRPLF